MVRYVCQNNVTNEPVQDELCNVLQKPQPKMASCNVQACPPRYYFQSLCLQEVIGFAAAGLAKKSPNYSKRMYIHLVFEQNFLKCLFLFRYTLLHFDCTELCSSTYTQVEWLYFCVFKFSRNAKDFTPFFAKLGKNCESNKPTILPSQMQCGKELYFHEKKM